MITLDQARPLFAWMAERHAIYMRKTYLEEAAFCGEHFNPIMSEAMRGAWGDGSAVIRDGNAGTWKLAYLTDDPILGSFRFCNVYRELDRVTVWIREHIREPFYIDRDLWFMLAAARWINWPPTMKMLMHGGAWPGAGSWDPAAMVRLMKSFAARGNKVFTGAYLITNNGVSMPKEEYVVHRVLEPLWNDRMIWRSYLEPEQKNALTMEEVHAELQKYNGFGSFIAGQMTTDLRHTWYLDTAPDRAYWAAVGPGSARGLNRLAGRPLDGRVRQGTALEELRQIQSYCPDLLAPWMTVPELTDLQNCCCEFDKYERARLGQGRPRSRYVPGRGY